MIAAWDTPIAGVTILASVLCLGAARGAWYTRPLAPDDLRTLPDGPVTLIGYPADALIMTDTGWHVPFRLLATERLGRLSRAAGLLYLSGMTNAPLPGRYYRVDGQVRAIRDPGNPADFSFRSFLLEHGYTYPVRAVTLALLPGDAPVSRLAQWREALHRRLAATFPGSYRDLYAQLLDSVLLGIHGAALPEQFILSFRRAGIIHLMVVSGGQVALLASFLLFPLWFTPRGRVGSTFPIFRVAMLALSLPGLALYVALADRGPSVDRALLMALLSILAIFLGFSPLARRRAFRPDGLTLLAAAALVVTAVNPAMLRNPGMQLSFAAVFGLMTIATPLRRLLEHSLGKLALWPAATLGAQLITVPILAWHFGVIPVLGLFTNLIAVPLVALLVPLGFLTLCCAVLWPPAAMAFNLVNVPLLRGLLDIGQVATAIPWAEWHWVIRSPLVVIGYQAGLALLTWLLSRWADSMTQKWRIPAGGAPVMW